MKFIAAELWRLFVSEMSFARSSIEVEVEVETKVAGSKAAKLLLFLET